MKKLFLFSLALLFWLGACGKDEAAKPEDQPALTSVSEITGVMDRSGLVGRKVEISGVKVRDVVGDYVFWAGEAGAELPVSLESELRGTGAESNIRIRRGMTLTLSGTVRQVSSLTDDDPFWGLVDSEEKAQIQASGVYIAADVVRE